MNKRIWGAVALVVAAQLVVALRPATASDYPSQDISIICAFPAGSGADVIVRFFADKIKAAAGRTVIVENKPGAAGNIAAEYLARAKPDGHTIMIHAANGLASNTYLIKNNPVDAAKRIQVAATINQMGFVFAVHEGSQAKTFGDLVALLKRKGDKASFGSAANSGQILGALLNEQAGLAAVQVQYRNAVDSLGEMANGALDYAILDPPLAMAQQRAGRIRVLSIVASERQPFLPDVPTMGELGHQMELRSWFAAMVPAGTPRPVVDQINEWMRGILAREDTRAFLFGVGSTPWPSTPDEAQAKLLKDIAAWDNYVKIAKLVAQ